MPRETRVPEPVAATPRRLPAALVLSAVLVTSCADEPTSPTATATVPTDGPPAVLDVTPAGENPDSLPPGSFRIYLFVDDISTGTFTKRQFASYGVKTLVKLTGLRHTREGPP